MPLQSLIHRWKAEGLTLLPPESPESIAKAFLQAGSKATADVIQLYATFGGMVIPDDGMVRLWPLKEVVEASDHSEFGVLFADYSLDAWCFRLQPVSSDESTVYVDHFNGSPPKCVAKNVLEFWAVYEHQPEKVHAW